MQLLGCRANLQATKHAFMVLSRAFTSWHLLLQQHQRLEAASDTLEVCSRGEGTAQRTASDVGVRALPRPGLSGFSAGCILLGL